MTTGFIYVNIDLHHQYGISVAGRDTSLSTLTYLSYPQASQLFLHFRIKLGKPFT